VFVNPPPLPDPDAERLRVLAILHYVLAALCFVGIIFLGLHFAFMTAFLDIFTKTSPGPGAHSPPNFKEVSGILHWFYLAMASFWVVASVVSFLSARFMQQRRYRTFSIVVAGIACAMVPIGTLLGVFTLLALTKHSAPRLYGEAGGESC
jgi:hypothetical protein